MRMKKITRMLVEEANLNVPNLKDDLKMMLDQYYVPAVKIKKTKLFDLKRSIATLSFALALVIFVIIPTLNLNTPSVNIEDTYVSIDINPSIELIVNSENKIESYRAMNKDAQLLLFEIDLTDYTLEAATTKILNLAVNLGYIDTAVTNNAIMITTINTNELLEKTVTSKMIADLDNYLLSNELKDKVNVLSSNDDSYKETAKELGLSVGKYILVTKAIEADPNLTINTAKNMSVKALNEKIKNYNYSEIETYRNTLSSEFSQQQNEYHENRQTMESDLRQLNELLEKLDRIENSHNPSNRFKELKPTILAVTNSYNYELVVSIDDKYSTELIDSLIDELEVLKEVAEQDLDECNENYEQKKEEFKKQEKGKVGDDGDDQDSNEDDSERSHESNFESNSEWHSQNNSSWNPDWNNSWDPAGDSEWHKEWD